MKEVISIIQNSEAAYLATVDKEGRPEIRALLNLCNPKKFKKLESKTLFVDGEKLTMYFTTNTSSKKVSNQMNKIFYKGFTDEEILQFDSMLERILSNCKEAEKQV